MVIVRVETMRLWCKEGKQWLNKLGWRIIEVTGDIKAINLYKEALYSTKRELCHSMPNYKCLEIIFLYFD